MRVPMIVLGALLLAVTAGAAQEKDKKAAKKDRNVITLEEVEKANVNNVHQAIKRLRPAWLTSRGSTSLTMPVSKDNAIGIYLDGVRRGEGVAELEAIAIEQVGEIRYYSAEAAVTKFGSGNPLGAIDVISRR